MVADYDRALVPARHRLLSKRSGGRVALVLLVVACALVVSDSGPNQAAHYALVRALADGTAEIDPRETIDASYVDGRYYAAKAPGLALFTLPWYGLLRAVGLQDGAPASASDYRHRVWELALVGSVLPFAVLLVLVLATAERLVPGFGAPTAILLGSGMLLLPFATLFFDHALGAALGYAAFAALLLARGSPGPGRLALAGLLAGLAIVVEFPLALVALLVGGYASRGARPARRLAAYGAGLLVGVVPLLAYNTWAFGSPVKLSYTNALEAEVGSGAPVVGANDEGFYGVGFPDPRAALSLLLSEKGLAIVTPLALVALAGLPLLWRAGRRAEALVCAAVPALFLAYNAAYYLPFGGQGPGPRFLVAALPFLGLPLAHALRARPLVIAGIAVVSTGVMVLATLTGPLTGVEYGLETWLERLGDGEVVVTVPGRLGLDPVVGAGLVAAVVLAALLAVLARLPLRTHAVRDAPLLAGTLGAWLVLASAAPDLLPADAENGTAEGTVAATLLLALLAGGLVLARTRRPIMLVPLVPAAILAAPQLGDRPRVSLLVVLCVLGLGVIAWWRLDRVAQVSADSSSHG